MNILPFRTEADVAVDHARSLGKTDGKGADSSFGMYFYHSDLCESREQSQACLSYAEMKQSVRSKHLGSAAYLTNNGQVTQTLNYLPYGEDWVDIQHYVSARYSNMELYTFTDEGNASGFPDSKAQRECFAEYYDFSSITLSTKQDFESGYHYFGARYYDSEALSGWLSVDPMSDKYPSLSPYAYCAWNPVKLVDPDGREIWIGTYMDKKTSKYTPNSKANKAGIAQMLDNIYNKSKAGKFVISTLVNTDKKYYISKSANPNGNGNPDYTNGDGKHRQIYLNGSKNIYTLSHELFHAFQHENEQWDASRSCEVEAFVFAGIVNTQINGGKFRKDLLSLGGQHAYTGISSSKECNSYASSMISLTKSFNAKEMAYAVSHFRNFSKAGSGYSHENGYKYCLSGDRYNSNSSLLNQYKSNIY